MSPHPVETPEASSTSPAGRGGAVLAGIVSAAAVVRVVSALPEHRRPGGAQRWQRTNHAGGQVSLWEGPAVAAGLFPAALTRPAVGIAALGAGAVGVLDDLRGGDDGKGLRGHLGALRAGHLTTGVVKIATLAGTGLLSTAVSDAAAGRRPGVTTVVGGAAVAGMANLVNLFDLRPGRALKVTTALAAVPLLAGAGGYADGVVIGAALAAAPEDVAGEQMMGDTGANALGAAVGVLQVARLGLRGRVLLLGGVTAVTLASERVSFSAVIEAHPLLRRIDQWGRPHR